MVLLPLVIVPAGQCPQELLCSCQKYAVLTCSGSLSLQGRRKARRTRCSPCLRAPV
ncbi:MAG: hypothetical protein AVDCRST_MAG68-4294 [uncultured Gemmatimonadetes bacterium]|uniref:Uncharacterized protein n=1 Tax=uncultured Gemmatimonadota bacterium TaxID=203437 RepID=A0A6J4MGZ3_9BACT|nr:MAG: hypothetical protein AVDCRST_MAG68-4294 [uncultured Gemmatimonadota bacterium]